MKNEDDNLKKVPKENPFRVPEGYMEGLTARIMKQIPDEMPQIEPQEVSLWEKVRPILYLAAMFVGLGLFFEAIAYFDTSEEASIVSDSLLVNTEVPDQSLFTEEDSYNEDEDYLAYIEDRYADALIQEELNEEE